MAGDYARDFESVAAHRVILPLLLHGHSVGPLPLLWSLHCGSRMTNSGQINFDSDTDSGQINSNQSHFRQPKTVKIRDPALLSEGTHIVDPFLLLQWSCLGAKIERCQSQTRRSNSRYWCGQKWGQCWAGGWGFLSGNGAGKANSSSVASGSIHPLILARYSSRRS